MQYYLVTKRFTSGLLKGLTHTELTSVKFAVGFHCKRHAYNPSAYTVTSVMPVFV